MLKQFLTLFCASGLFLASVGCDVEKTSEGRLPDVDVDPGAVPSYDVDTPDVDVSMERETVTVPDIDVDTKEAVIDVPDVDVTLPKDE